MLPELNSEDKPELVQIPIIVEGEEDGQFNSQDRIIFFGSSPHNVIRTSSSFSHEIHPYSNLTYVFLTVGSSIGSRLVEINPSGVASTSISSFTDFNWKEQELNKAEDRQKVGVIGWVNVFLLLLKISPSLFLKIQYQELSQASQLKFQEKYIVELYKQLHFLSLSTQNL